MPGRRHARAGRSPRVSGVGAERRTVPVDRPSTRGTLGPQRRVRTVVAACPAPSARPPRAGCPVRVERVRCRQRGPWRLEGRQFLRSAGDRACGNPPGHRRGRGDITARRAEAPAIVTRMGRDRFAGSVRRGRDPVGNRLLRVEAANRARAVGRRPEHANDERQAATGRNRTCTLDAEHVCFGRAIGEGVQQP